MLNSGLFCQTLIPDQVRIMSSSNSAKTCVNGRVGNLCEEYCFLS